MMERRIYLDHAATTPLHPDVTTAMAPYFTSLYGNPSSQHSDGQQAKRAIDAGRDILASAIGAKDSEIIFTSGGTEADNMALFGIMLANRSRGNHLITTQIEHEAVLKSSKLLMSLGFDVTYIQPDNQGLIDTSSIEEAITDKTVLISVMHANNEVGIIQPIREIADIAHSHNITMHTDAVQSFGQIPVNVNDLSVDLLTLSAHKIYGPKGVGALYLKDGIPFESLLKGGNQERERRAGTENVAGIAGFGKAIELVMELEYAEQITRLRDYLIDEIIRRFPFALINGSFTNRLPNNANLSFIGYDAEIVLLNLDLMGVSASSGSACTSGSIEPSHVLQAMGLNDRLTKSAIRFTLGRSTTDEEIDAVINALGSIFKRISGG